MYASFTKLIGASAVATIAVFAPLSLDVGALADGSSPIRLNGACAGATTCSLRYFDICSSANGNDYEDYECATGCGDPKPKQDPVLPG